jgi:peptidoglycan/LPS O-acetylase OafA/YrhL
LKLSYYKELDGVRAIAALMVMLFHFLGSVTTNNALILFLKKISIFGQTGVSLFFVLSGFLISRILISTKNEPKYFYKFYVKRILRIFPLYYFFLVLYFFVFPLLLNIPTTSIKDQLYYWFYIQNVAMTFNLATNGPLHFWSLAVEEHFYLFWPIVIYYFNDKKIVTSIFLLILFSIITRYLLAKNNIEVFYFTFSRLDEILLGAFLAILELKGYLHKKNAYKFLLALLCVIIPTVLLWKLNNASGNPNVQVVKFLLMALFYACSIGFILSTASTNNLLSKLMNINFLRYTGKISYGLYVYHPICFLVIANFFKLGLVMNFTCSFALSYLISSISYHYFESKFLNLKIKFI